MPKPVEAERLLEQLQRHLQLKWEYAPAIQDEPTETRPMIFPSADETALLHQLSLEGDINQLRARAEILAQSDPKLKPFVARMNQFLKIYQLDEFNEWLETPPPGPPSPGGEGHGENK